MRLRRFINYTQFDAMDCGPTCLKMVAQYYGKSFPLNFLRDQSRISKNGVSLFSIREAAESIGFEAEGVIITIEQLNTDVDYPIIIHWDRNHFVVLKKITINKRTKKTSYHIADPARGQIVLNGEQFKKSWLSDDNYGVALTLFPTEDFYNYDSESLKNNFSVKFIFTYLKPHSKNLVWMFLLLLLGTGVNLLFPFLTQNLIDKGVGAKNTNLIITILLAQLVLYLGTITFEIIRSWLMLNIGTKISIVIISDFLKKILQLPIGFFESKLIGDFNQRIQDNEKIEEFLTSQGLNTFFSIITFSVFFMVLWYYDLTIVLTYILLTTLSVSWSFYWLKKRKKIDYHRFHYKSQNQESIYEMINGVVDMKLNQYEDLKRKEWQNIQGKLFETNIRFLKINQLQLSGFEFINQIKNILVTFLAAMLVVHGNITIGAMMSISYIIGQMNSPVMQLVNFFRSLQDAKLSLERLNEVQNHQEEELEDLVPLNISTSNNNDRGIDLTNVSFQYEGPKSSYVLKDIDFKIPEGKVTAVVGASGSGKTTLMKLLLSFYKPVEGNIYFNGDSLHTISPKNLRENCGAVMQDGYIFSETIERNIATGDERVDEKRLNNALKIANIEEFIETLPLGINTKIGASGNGLSGGQKQRILIARAVYKDPHYIFFDEATSALDAENEKIIHDHLQTFFKGKTVLIIAHRLSTVKNADQIIVLKNGHIVEKGDHHTLTFNKGEYYNLVKNQLELGN